MHGVLLKYWVGLWEGGMLGFVDVEDNVGGVGRTWKDCEVGWVGFQRCLDDRRGGVP